MKAFKELKDYASKRLNYKNWYKLYLKVVPKTEVVDNKVIARNMQKRLRKEN